MPYQAFRIRIQDFSVPYLHSCRLPAIQAWGVNSDCFPGKKPADRQRFECSLAKPLLLTVDGDAKLSWKVVKGGH